MNKKVTQRLTAHLAKNILTEKGGAWLLTIIIRNDGETTSVLNTSTAWSNPSAAKRYLKEVVLANTPRKSIKMAVSVTDVPTGKPLKLDGELIYKADA